MSGKPRSYEEELRRLCDAMAESVAGMTEDEALAEARGEGIDTKAEADRLRKMARDTANDVRLGALREAKIKHDREQSAILSRSFHIPEAAGDRRALLQHLIATRPTLSVAARELADIPDDAVESMLRDLEALGAFDQEPTK